MSTERTRIMSFGLWLLSVLVVSSALAACTPTPPGQGQPTPSPAVTSTPATDIVTVLDQHREELMELPGVVGVGIGQDETTGYPIILILLIEESTPELEKALPEELGGFVVKPLVVGEPGIQ